jgi:serine/threonine protein kinase/tetratricopeptide (TPR) repeat protein
MIGKTINHYKIIEKLGEGGMGVVYKARDTKLDRTVALKFLPAQISLKEEDKKRFVHEAKSAAALDHPNICTIHEIGETKESQLFIAMSYYAGKTLKEKIAEMPLPVDQAAEIAKQVAEGLGKAHKNNIIHRDIKSANIMITDEGVVKILDFGLAKLPGLTKLTKEGTTLGTVSYMSPEQVSGEETDHRSDIWSLGVVLYEMITGQLPFKGEYEQAILYAIMNQEPEPITGLRTGVPLELEGIIAKALAKDPDDRYQHVEDLQVDLKRLMKKMDTPGSKTSDSRDPATLERTKKIPVLRKRVGWIAGGLAVILIIAGLLVFRSPSDLIDSLAILPFVNQNQNQDVAWLSTGIPETVITSLQQIPNLRVTSFLTLLERYKNDQPTVDEVRRDYRVRAVAKGKVEVVKKSLSVHIEIVDTEDNSIIFARKYGIQGMEGLYDLQKTIARDITDHLKQHLTSDDIQPVFTKHTANSAAHHYYLRGRHHWYKRTPRDLQVALDYFKKAIDIDPDYALAWSGLADTYHLMPQNVGTSRYRVIPLARKAAEKALSLDDTLAETHTAMGGVLDLEQKYDEAEKHFRKALEINPNYLLAYHWSGLNFDRSRNFKDSINRYEEALKLDPMSPFMAGNLALDYLELQNYKMAREILDRSLALNPESANLYLAYAWLHYDQGDHPKSLEMAEKALSQNRFSLHVIGQAALVIACNGRLERAIEIPEAAMAREPAFSRALHSILGWIYSRVKQHDRALEHHRKALELDPLDIDSYQQLGWTHYHAKDWQKAAAAFKKITELQPGESRAFQLYGCVLGLLGQAEAEWEQYERATQLQPFRSIELGCWHLNYGNYPQAVKRLIQAEKDGPNYPNTSFYLFTAQFLTGDSPGAEKSLSRWLKLLKYEKRDSLRQQAFPDGVVNRHSLIGYMRLILERFKEEKRPIRGRYEARFPATLYCLSGDFESTIQTLEYAYEHFENDSEWLPWYIRFHYFKPLHKDPRFWEIVNKMKLDPYFKKETATSPSTAGKIIK